MEYYSAIKKTKIMAFAGKRMELEDIMLSEISQSQKTQRPNDFSDKWMMIYKPGWGGQEFGKNGGSMNSVEEGSLREE